MLGYRDSGMPESPANDHPDSFHQADIDEATGRLVAVIRRTRPQVIITYGDDQQRLPAPRPPQGARHLRAGVRAGRRPRLVPRARRAVPAVEAVLLDVVTGPAARRPRGAASSATARRRTTRSGSTGPTRTTASPPASTSATSCSLARRRCGPTPRRSIPTEAWWFGLDDAEMADVYPWEDWILARSLVGDPHRGDRGRPLRRRAASVSP